MKRYFVFRMSGHIWVRMSLCFCSLRSANITVLTSLGRIYNLVYSLFLFSVLLFWLVCLQVFLIISHPSLVRQLAEIILKGDLSIFNADTTDANASSNVRFIIMCLIYIQDWELCACHDTRVVVDFDEFARWFTCSQKREFMNFASLTPL